MKHCRQGRAAELETGTPTTRHVAEPNCEQNEDRQRRDHDGNQRELDRLTGDRPPHLQDLAWTPPVHGAEPGLQVVLNIGLLRRA